jgi:hypothetical protein
VKHARHGRRGADDAGRGVAQPNNHDFAYSILKAISGHGYGERDYAVWEKWFAGAIKT